MLRFFSVFEADDQVARHFIALDKGKRALLSVAEQFPSSAKIFEVKERRPGSPLQSASLRENDAPGFLGRRKPVCTLNGLSLAPREILQLTDVFFVVDGSGLEPCARRIGRDFLPNVVMMGMWLSFPIFPRR